MKKYLPAILAWAVIPVALLFGASNYNQLIDPAYTDCPSEGGTFVTSYGITMRCGVTSTGSIPSGSILLVDAGTCPTGFSEVAGLNGKTLFGTVTANADVGATGGADNITPAGTNSAPGFTGDAVASNGVSAGTPAGTNSTSSVTPLGTVAAPAISWPAGVPTFAGAAFSNVINHTHAVNVTDPGHTHLTQRYPTATGGSSGFTIDTSMSGTLADNTLPVKANATGVTATSSNPGGGVASITPAGTIAWPVGVPTNTVPAFTGSSSTVSAQTFTGSALGTHSHNTTATGIVAAPSFTGSSFDNRSAFVKVIFCKKT